MTTLKADFGTCLQEYHSTLTQARQEAEDRLKELEAEEEGLKGYVEELVRGLINCHLKWIDNRPYVYSSYRVGDKVCTHYWGALNPVRGRQAPSELIAALKSKPGLRGNIQGALNRLKEIKEEKRELKELLSKLSSAISSLEALRKTVEKR